jgi:hypothetical protein
MLALSKAKAPNSRRPTPLAHLASPADCPGRRWRQSRACAPPRLPRRPPAAAQAEQQQRQVSVSWSCPLPILACNACCQDLPNSLQRKKVSEQSCKAQQQPTCWASSISSASSALLLFSRAGSASSTMGRTSPSSSSLSPSAAAAAAAAAAPGRACWGCPSSSSTRQLSPPSLPSARGITLMLMLARLTSPSAGRCEAAPAGAASARADVTTAAAAACCPPAALCCGRGCVSEPPPRMSWRDEGRSARSADAGALQPGRLACRAAQLRKALALLDSLAASAQMQGQQRISGGHQGLPASQRARPPALHPPCPAGKSSHHSHAPQLAGRARHPPPWALPHPQRQAAGRAAAAGG